jgi:D-glycero-D-manno-heptose 1,7-bisphosphate phosphatase
LEAIADLNRHGFKVAVITNQSGLARGLFDLAALEAMHAKMQRLLAELGGEIDAIYFCPHGPDDRCECRKPKAGLFKTFAEDKQADLRTVYAIGDSYRDIQAAQAAGARPVLVKTGKGLQALKSHPRLNLPIFENLYDAAHYIVSQS